MSDRILVVDDDPDGLKVTVVALERAGFDVVTAVDADQALELLRSERPDLVLLDVVLPGRSGVDLLEVLRSDASLPPSSVILMSSIRVGVDEQSDGLDAGADGYIVRPIHPQELVARVRSQLRQHELASRLRSSEARFRQLIEQRSDGVVVVDESGVITLANQTAADLLGCSSDDLVGTRFPYPLDHDADNLEVDLPRADGQVVSVTLDVALSAWDGAPAMIVSVRDVGRQRQAEAALREAKAELARSDVMLEMAATLSRLGAWRVDLVTSDVTWSSEVRRIHEVPPEFVPTLESAIGFYREGYRRRIRKAVDACLESGAPFDLECEITTFGGGRKWVRTIGVAERDADGAIIASEGALQDISDRVSAEERERALTNRLVALLESIGDGFVLVDADWSLTFVNDRASEMIGRGRDELLGAGLWEALPDARGTPFEASLRRAVAEGTSTSFEELYGPLDRWFGVTAHPIEEGLAIYFRDVTERRRIDQQVHRSQHLEALGQLTGGVAHDFNNLLTVILGSAELLVHQLDDRPDAQDLARMTIEAAQRGADLTRHLLAFARRQPLDPKRVDVRVLLQGLDGMLRRTLGEDVEIRFIGGAAVWPALVDAGQLQSALLNLALNARDAMPAGGRLTIETDNALLDSEYVARHDDVEPGEYVMIAVSDTGHGIPQDVVDRVFDPFFTTKAPGKGTGLGMSMVYGFVKQSRGHVAIYTEDGEGTTVRIYLPRASEGDVEEVPPTTEEKAARGFETILLVEDDHLVRTYTRGQLLALGYTVLEATTGPEALGVLRAHPEIDLLFTDIVMPGGMTGRDLVEAARGIREGIRVLYTSGYTEDAIVHQGRLDPGVRLLVKPYRRADLAHAVRDALDA